MAAAPVRPEKEEALRRLMARLGIHEQDLDEQFVRGSGKGGQKKNKTSSCVVLRHRPSGIEVRCQSARSQSLNRFLARRELCERLAAQQSSELSRADREAAKIRRQKARRSRRTKAKMLADKQQRAIIKELRRPPDRG